MYILSQYGCSLVRGLNFISQEDAYCLQTLVAVTEDHRVTVRKIKAQCPQLKISIHQKVIHHVGHN